MNKIDQIVELIFNNISTRVTNRKKQLKKTRSDITNESNVQLLSSIMNNQRVPSRNPYLLNASITDDIVSNLNFHSSYELIWGDHSDLDILLKQIFYAGISLLKQNNLIEECRLTYLPYAKASAKFNFANELEKPDLETLVEEQEYASEYVFFYINDKLKEEHKNFFSKSGTKKINKQLFNFINTTFPRLFSNFLSETNHQGKQVYELMSSIIKYENEDIFESIAHGPEWFQHEPLTNSEIPLSDVRKNIINTGEKYIDALLNEQFETDYFFNDLRELS
ncbi:hypothetical protein HUK49_09660 [Limosilactobacillus sp. c11Ua_112_M]|uniref:hypothetical protein n=1 Tax=Limosilactobacillus TaxID=2742598 RepID=UPI00177DC3CD|nr:MULTISPECIES: hypothetical protein [Limosilactobacillus]MBD8088167.1 hypothetical protein [Limosilactobacillus portuensis]MEC4742709.1 hypothetical protein [Limosilactobacillus sp. c10Ua_36]